MSGAVWFLPLGSFSGLGRFPHVCIDSTADSRAESSESLQSSPGAQPSPLHILPCELWPPRPPAPSPARPPQRRKPAGLLPAHLFGKRLPAVSWRSCSPPVCCFSGSLSCVEPLTSDVFQTLCRELWRGASVLCGPYSSARPLPAPPAQRQSCQGLFLGSFLGHHRWNTVTGTRTRKGLWYLLQEATRTCLRFLLAGSWSSVQQLSGKLLP